jgi:signal transduction histidine kinase
MGPHLDPRALAVTAITRLADAGVVAVLLLDDCLIVRGSYGRLADQVPHGIPVDEGLPHLTGLAPDLLNLQDEPDAIFALDNVGIAGPDGAVKLNIEAFWIAEERHYYLLLHRLGLRSEPEAEITKQIRARRIAEEHLQRTRRDLASQSSLVASLSEHAPVALAIAGPDLTYELATEAWRRLLGLSSDPLVGSRIDASPSAAALAEGCGIDLALAGQSPPERQITVTVSGRSRTLLARATPIDKGEGRGFGVIILAREVTGDAAAIAALRKRVDLLEASNRALEEFVAAAAHDLDQPRRAIERALSEGEPIGWPAVADASARLKHMLADLLAHARAGAEGGAPESIDLQRLAAEALMATDAGERFTLVCPGTAAGLLAPRIPLEIALRNLIANAVNHHDRATGTIEVRLESDAHLWRMTVGDDGPGIAEAERARVFEPFRRLSAAGPGTGLGLSIVATAVRRLGGSIRISGREGARGTAVVITWPKHGSDAPAGLDSSRP